MLYLQGNLAHKKQPTSLGPPQGPRHSPTVGSQVGAVSYERGTPVGYEPHVEQSDSVPSEGGERRILGGVPRERKMLKGHLPRVIYDQ